MSLGQDSLLPILLPIIEQIEAELQGDLQTADADNG